MSTTFRVARSVALAMVVSVTAEAQGLGGLIPTADGPPPTRAGTRGANWLHVPVGARTNAMGGAVGASVVGALSWFVNPAGAATVEQVDVAFGRQNLYGDLGIKQSFLAIAFPAMGGAIGLAVNSLSSGDMRVTNEGTPFSSSQVGTFSWTSVAAAVGYARRLTDRLDVGGAFKLVSEGIPQIKNRFVSADIGIRFRTGLFGTTVGGSLLTVGNAAHMDGVGLERGVNTNDVSRAQTRFKLYTRPVDLPTTFKFSVGDDLLGSAESLFGRGSGRHTVLSEIAISRAVDAATQMGVGVEYGFKNMAFARAGKVFYNDGRNASDDGAEFGLSGGFGLRVALRGRPFRFDYSYTALGDLRDIQVFSFEIGGQ